MRKIPCVTENTQLVEINSFAWSIVAEGLNVNLILFELKVSRLENLEINKLVI